MRDLDAQARRMADTIAHRGPDDSGTWADDDAGVALAHRRLSVIDLSAEGHQPMSSASGRYVIAYNGEIYNYAEVRRELEACGAAPRWRGHSDTEVALAAVERWGIDGTLQRCNGMFAFALWDRKDRVLHLARDRMGEKPLYYGSVGAAFAFGSELKALRALPGFVGEIDRDAVAFFLRFNYVPAPWWMSAERLPSARSRTSTSRRSRERRSIVTWRSAKRRRWSVSKPSSSARYGCAWCPTCRSAPSCRAASIPRWWSH
jgi:asparagine synthase (glutamine-hydrolysing)